MKYNVDEFQLKLMVGRCRYRQISVCSVGILVALGISAADWRISYAGLSIRFDIKLAFKRDSAFYFKLNSLKLFIFTRKIFLGQMFGLTKQYNVLSATRAINAICGCTDPWMMVTSTVTINSLMDIDFNIMRCKPKISYELTFMWASSW